MLRVVVLLVVFPVVAGNAAYYSDQTARNLLSAAAAGFATKPDICLQKVFPVESWRLIDEATFFDKKLRGNVTVFSVLFPHLSEILFSIAAVEPTDKDQLTGLLNYNRPVDFHNYGSVNDLFFHIEEEAWNHVHKVVALADYSAHPVTFTGYSIGGAIATLVAMRTVSSGLRSSSAVTLMTFGEPRVGNLNFANSVNREILHVYRVTHASDPVVHMPPCLSEGKYTCTTKEPLAPHHHGTEIFYDNDMRYGADFVRCTHDDEDAKCSNSKVEEPNFSDHEYYFQHRVTSYGRNDCTDVDPAQVNASATFLTLPAVLSLLWLLLV